LLTINNDESLESDDDNGDDELNDDPKDDEDGLDDNDDKDDDDDDDVWPLGVNVGTDDNGGDAINDGEIGDETVRVDGIVVALGCGSRRDNTGGDVNEYNGSAPCVSSKSIVIRLCIQHDE
jgi:hypothetical protein